MCCNRDIENIPDLRVDIIQPGVWSVGKKEKGIKE